MARKRMIDPSIWTDEGMAALTPRQQLLYIGLVSNADDDGRMRGSAVAVRLMLPTVLGEATVAEVEADLQAVLGQMRKLVRYQHDGNTYLCFVNYARWQNINRPTPSRLPSPTTNDVIPSDRDMTAHISISDRSLSSEGQTRVVENKLEEVRTERESIADPPREPAADPTPMAPTLVMIDESTAAEPEPAPTKPPRYTARFEAIWSAFPTSDGMSKAKAFAVYKGLRTDADTDDAILAGIANWKRGKRWQEGFVMSLERWLRERNWEVTVEPWSPNGLPMNGKNQPIAPREAGIVAWKRRRESRTSGDSALSAGRR